MLLAGQTYEQTRIRSSWKPAKTQPELEAPPGVGLGVGGWYAGWSGVGGSGGSLTGEGGRRGGYAGRKTYDEY